MTKVALGALLLAFFFSAQAQTKVNNEKLVAQIKSIDQAELAAFFSKDFPSLEKILGR